MAALGRSEPAPAGLGWLHSNWSTRSAELLSALGGIALASPQRYLHRMEKGFIAEGLLQKANGARLDGPCPCRLVILRCDENDWNSRRGRGQLLLQLQTVHARHLEIEDQAARVLQVVRSQEVLGRGECLCAESDRSQETPQRLPVRLIIVHDCDDRSFPLAHTRSICVSRAGCSHLWETGAAARRAGSSPLIQEACAGQCVLRAGSPFCARILRLGAFTVFWKLWPISYGLELCEPALA